MLQTFPLVASPLPPSFWRVRPNWATGPLLPAYDRIGKPSILSAFPNDFGPLEKGLVTGPVFVSPLGSFSLEIRFPGG